MENKLQTLRIPYGNEVIQQQNGAAKKPHRYSPELLKNFQQQLLISMATFSLFFGLSHLNDALYSDCI